MSKKLSILVLIMMFSAALTLSANEYTLKEMLMFHPYGFNIGFSNFIASKDKFRDYYSVSAPWLMPEFGINYRLSKMLSANLQLTYLSSVHDSNSKVKLAVPEAALSLEAEYNIWENLFISGGAGVAFYAALSSAEIQTVNDSKLTVGKQNIRKVKYGYGVIFCLGAKYYINASNAFRLGVRHNITRIGDPGSDGFGNLGGTRIFLNYFYYF